MDNKHLKALKHLCLSICFLSSFLLCAAFAAGFFPLIAEKLWPKWIARIFGLSMTFIILNSLSALNHIRKYTQEQDEELNSLDAQTD